MRVEIKCPYCGVATTVCADAISSECYSCLKVINTAGEMCDIVGKTPKKIDQTEEEIVFLFEDGSSCVFFHKQECCEDVTVEDVNGDWSDLVGVPVLVAEERQSSEAEALARPSGRDGHSFMWTFYTFRSITGSVDVRWLGTSNGCYSESVDFLLAQADTAGRRQ